MTITSKEVAEMLGKRHDNLLRAIRKYITQLGEEALSISQRIQIRAVDCTILLRLAVILWQGVLSGSE